MHLYTRTIPLLLTFLMGGFILLLPRQPALLGTSGLLVSGLSILATLPGFYFAGLAAVATFNGLNMDVPMENPPHVSVTVGGVVEELELTRRQFLSYLFCYLVFLSFALCIVAIAAMAATPSLALLKQWIVLYPNGWPLWGALRAAGLLIYLAGVSSLIVTTLHGMFFLTERIHQP